MPEQILIHPQTNLPCLTRRSSRSKPIPETRSPMSTSPQSFAGFVTTQESLVVAVYSIGNLKMTVIWTKFLGKCQHKSRLLQARPTPNARCLDRPSTPSFLQALQSTLTAQPARAFSTRNTSPKPGPRYIDKRGFQSESKSRGLSLVKGERRHTRRRDGSLHGTADKVLVGAGCSCIDYKGEEAE